MLLWEKLLEEREKGWEEGWKEGREEGWKEGRILGAIESFRKYLGMDNPELMKQLITEFSMTAEEAAYWIEQAEKSRE